MDEPSLHTRADACADAGCLLDLAQEAASEDPDTARGLIERAEALCEAPDDYVRTARTALGTTAQPTAQALAAEILLRGSGRFSAPAALALFARTFHGELGDAQTARHIYLRALEDGGDTASLLELTRTINDDLSDPDLTAEALEKAEGAARDSDELIAVARAAAGIGLGERIGRLLEGALDRSEKLEELQRVAESAGELLPPENEHRKHIEEALAHRATHEAAYRELRRAEAHAGNWSELITLADRAATDLADRDYAARLLNAAEAQLHAAPLNLQGYRELLLAVEHHLGDRRWLSRLLDVCAERAETFADLSALGRFALHDLEDRELAAERMRHHYGRFSDMLAEAEESAPYDFTKLAAAVRRDLGDLAWTHELLVKAEQRAEDRFALAEVARHYLAAGDQESAERLFQSAAQRCRSGEECIQLMQRLRRYGLSDDDLRSYYTTCFENLSGPAHLLRWAEGILEVFRDEAWARQVYAELSGEFNSDEERRRFEESQRLRFGRRLY